MFSHLPLHVDYFPPRPPAFILNPGRMKQVNEKSQASCASSPHPSILRLGGGGEGIHLKGKVANYIFLQLYCVLFGQVIGANFSLPGRGRHRSCCG